MHDNRIRFLVLREFLTFGLYVYSLKLMFEIKFVREKNYLATTLKVWATTLSFLGTACKLRVVNLNFKTTTLDF